MSKSFRYDAVVIGGGFFGCTIALHLKKYMKYILIALRSKINFPHFVNDYQECIDRDFNNYYAISKYFSKVNANQFKVLCERIDAPLEIAPPSSKKLFNKYLVEEVFITKEYVFDAVKLKLKIYSELEEQKIELKLNTEVAKLKNSTDSQEIEVFLTLN